MKCPTCGDLTEVVDSRPMSRGANGVRRRQCLSCPHRFTTYEEVTVSDRITEVRALRRRLDKIKTLVSLLNTQCKE